MGQGSHKKTVRFHHLGDEDNEDAAAAVEGDGDGEDRDYPAPPTHCLLTDAGVGVTYLHQIGLTPKTVKFLKYKRRFIIFKIRILTGNRLITYLSGVA